MKQTIRLVAHAGRPHWSIEDRHLPLVAGADPDEDPPTYFDLEGNEVDLENLEDGTQLYDAEGEPVTLDDDDDDDDDELGFPENTPLVKMTEAQRTAYWKHKARKHEDENKRLRSAKKPPKRKSGEPRTRPVASGKNTEDMTPEEIAEQVREETRRELAGDRVVDIMRTRLEAKGLDEDRIDTIIDGLDPKKYLDDESDVDADMVKAFIEGIAPAKPVRGGNGNARGADLGQGRRSGAPAKKGKSAGSVDRGRELFEERHGAKK